MSARPEPTPAEIGYDAAVAELRAVHRRTGSPAAAWAADYLAAPTNRKNALAAFRGTGEILNPAGDHSGCPTLAEIEAGANAAWNHIPADNPTPTEVRQAIRAALAAVLPDHDARIRAEAWRHAAQEIRDRLGAVTARRELPYSDGASDAARLLENMAGDLVQTYPTPPGEVPHAR